MFKHPGLALADFRYALLGSSLHSAGMIGEQVVVGFLVFEITDSTAWVGISLAIYFLPMLLLGIPAGVLADRFDRKTLLPVVEGLLTLTLSVVFLILYNGYNKLFWILILIFLTGSFRALHSAIKAGYIFDLTGAAKIVSSLALTNFGNRLGQLIGAFMTGILYHQYGSYWAVGALVAFHGIATILFCRLTTAGKSKFNQSKSIKGSLRDFWSQLKSNQNLQILFFLTIGIELFGFSFFTALPELAATRLSSGADGLGYLHACRSIGGICAAIALTAVLTNQRNYSIYLFTILGFGLFVASLGYTSIVILTFVFTATIAAMAVSTDILSQSMMQLIVPDEQRGKVMGVWVVAVGTAPIGHLLTGYLASLFGVSQALIINGSVLVIIGICFYLVTRTREFAEWQNV